MSICLPRSALALFATSLLSLAGATTALAQSPAKTRPGASPAAAAFNYAQSEAAMAFASDMAERRNLDPTWVRRQLGAAQRIPAVIRLMQPAPSGTPKNWAAYRARFIEPVRLRAGQRFWEDNREALARAEAEYGVPASLIVGVIGVESLYGRYTGNFRVIDALATLSFDFPGSHPRAATRTEFFRSELEQFLSLAERTGTDPASYLGSYAGAMGWPQFMPSSWTKYAIDFDADDKVDLFNSQADVIGSVANYFKAFGWQPGLPTHYPVRFDPNQSPQDLATLLAPDILPSFSVETFNKKGVLIESPLAPQHSGPLALVELQNASAPSTYIAGTQNFYVVTRYNWSSYYALAVIELGETVRQMMGER
ncbi:MAG: lytic murein transglycosylase B [Hydrogenophaga sp.]|jgi:membrane-bound lytic murein transglycosylase B|uniref:lytic murein transglycosylase B n=1 Tax=Hydrogenophaga sp. TaxID=1904254 RepID=UPI002607ECD1|nr:lytic murein transglycosylase B [Hydrogenophaga sp.]MCV0437952.1 lytic murein transglycosylase B [Hydrogenophaga sp.]